MYIVQGLCSVTRVPLSPQQRTLCLALVYSPEVLHPELSSSRPRGLVLSVELSFSHAGLCTPHSWCCQQQHWRTTGTTAAISAGGRVATFPHDPPSLPALGDPLTTTHSRSTSLRRPTQHGDPLASLRGILHGDPLAVASRSLRAASRSLLLGPPLPSHWRSVPRHSSLRRCRSLRAPWRPARLLGPLLPAPSRSTRLSGQCDAAVPVLPPPPALHHLPITPIGPIPYAQPLKPQALHSASSLA